LSFAAHLHAVTAVTFEYGDTFLAVAGLNLLVVLDAFDIATGRKTVANERDGGARQITPEIARPRCPSHVTRLRGRRGLRGSRQTRAMRVVIQRKCCRNRWGSFKNALTS
jgi:hypothetical protein